MGIIFSLIIKFLNISWFNKFFKNKLVKIIIPKKLFFKLLGYNSSIIIYEIEEQTTVNNVNLIVLINVINILILYIYNKKILLLDF